MSAPLMKDTHYRSILLKVPVRNELGKPKTLATIHSMPMRRNEECN